MDCAWGGIEAGGTNFLLAVGSGPGALRAEESFPTTTPTETVARAVQFFKKQGGKKGLTAIGIASFGPVDPNVSSQKYGFITSTPKKGWAQFNFAGFIQREIDVPVVFDTDVNGAALAEYKWGAAQGLDNFIYLTIGTGIGGGGMMNGKLMHGLIHPEMGHIPIPHDWLADSFKGSCPYHGDCLEGLASGPALEQRWGIKPSNLPVEHPAWELEAHYVAQAITTYIYTLSPQRILLAGGVMEQTQLFPMIRHKVQDFLNAYIQAPEILAEIEQYIVPPKLGKKAGVLGAIALAQKLKL
ncbi:ROK family protein [candidate division CSSED10-310 bacterium]|uniref:fructokinase n=1 Tax=candidate division CSSED10-310 bacterium TaxID=2855610 RepID=A0ABV6YV29_UNCC1